MLVNRTDMKPNVIIHAASFTLYPKFHDLIATEIITKGTTQFYSFKKEHPDKRLSTQIM